MKASLISILLATAAALVSAAPQPKPFLDGLGELEDLFRRAESTDGTCGGSKGFTCPSSGDKCCSQWGWCGSSSGHCGNGCQTAFGVSTSITSLISIPNEAYMSTRAVTVPVLRQTHKLPPPPRHQALRTHQPIRAEERAPNQEIFPMVGHPPLYYPEFRALHLLFPMSQTHLSDR